MTPRTAWRFWLSWAVASSLGAGAGYIVGIFVSFVVAAFPYLLGGLILGVLVGAAAAGLSVGVVVGAAQSIVLPWPRTVQDRWLRQSIIGWTAGAGLGAAVALVVEQLLVGASEPVLAPLASTYLVEIASPIIGLVVGWALRSVSPVPPARLSLWLAAHAVAVSGGWIVGRLATGGSSPISLTIPSLILGPVWYGVVSGLIMLTVVRRHPIAPANDPVDAGGV